MWVPATVEFEGQTWTGVGVRYKGNSSLASGWRSGALKLPLKLDFDEFEDEVPAIEHEPPKVETDRKADDIIDAQGFVVQPSQVCHRRIGIGKGLEISQKTTRLVFADHDLFPLFELRRNRQRPLDPDRSGTARQRLNGFFEDFHAAGFEEPVYGCIHNLPGGFTGNYQPGSDLSKLDGIGDLDHSVENTQTCIGNIVYLGFRPQP